MDGQEEKARKSLKRARVQLLMDYPFFGVLATQLELKPFRAPPQTAGLAIDGTHLYFDPGKVLKLSERELQGSLAHEVLHCSLGHPWRRENRDPMGWNYSTDFVVNLIVLGAKGESGMHSLKLPKGVLYDRSLKGKSAEQVYEELPSPKCPKCGSGNVNREKYESVPVDRRENKAKARASFRCGSCGHEWTEEETVKKGTAEDFPFPFDESDRDPQGPIDDHSKWENNADGKNGGEGQEPDEELEEKWKKRTVQAAQRAKSQGSLPAGIERLVEDLLYPKLDWRKLLNRYVTRHRGGRFDWRRPNKRWIQEGVYYPTKRERKLKAAIAVDTSGSISEKELRDFLSEMKGILTNFRSFEVRMFAADADIHTEETAETLQDFEQFQAEVKGGGGTDYRPVVEKLEKDDTDVLVYLGDMEATFPERPPSYDVVWVVSEKGDPDKPPFGEVVEMER